MGLETTTYVSGLTPSWPLSGDTKSQGDDHIRLIKATLQATFPTAAKPYYFPTAEVVTANQVLDATDQNNTMYLDTTGGALTVTLPTLTATDKGWRVDIVKSSTDTNGITVSPPSGNITSRVGNTATIRVGVAFEPATFIWTGAAWICHKPGAVIGQVFSYDGATTPAGFLDQDGSIYSNTTFAELFAVLATTTLRDRRGRADIGAGTGTGLTARTAGTTYGTEAETLTAAQIPAHSHPNTLTDNGHLHGGGQAGTQNSFGGTNGASQVSWSGAVGLTSVATTGIIINNANNTGGGGSHNNMQPSIAAKRIIRAC